MVWKPLPSAGGDCQMAGLLPFKALNNSESYYLMVKWRLPFQCWTLAWPPPRADVARLEPYKGSNATALCIGIVVISEYCKGNNSVVEYPLGLKLIELHIENVSFATDQTERHLEVGNTAYENYDSSAKRRLLVSLVLFHRIYYKGGMLGEQSASLPRASVLTEVQPVG
ncbi:hypothetical protein Fot_03126 [Forsythia ovata]|uniref:Uncharacterized protein n=1 Tax=Forsythia ovata TaxID=205694 RepID=A0ABD1X8T7_9LAMI